MDRVTMKVNGRVYGGWKTVKISRSLGDLAGQFDLVASDAWSATTRRPPAGAEAEIYLGDQRAIIGHLEEDDETLSDTTHTLSFGGRSLSGDVVFSHAEPGTFRGLTLGQIADRMCAAFGLGVRIDSDTDAIASHRIKPGETIAASLQRIAVPHQKVITDSPDGRLVITEGGAAQSDGAIIVGDNVLEYSRSINLSRRARHYVCRGQTSSEGEVLAHLKDEVIDEVFPETRPRTLHLTNETNGPRRSVAERVRIEASRRAGQSITYGFTVRGWFQPDGSLWDINERVPVTAPKWGLERAELLVTHVTYLLDERGSRTQMRVGPVVGWQPFPITEKKVPRSVGDYGFEALLADIATIRGETAPALPPGRRP